MGRSKGGGALWLFRALCWNLAILLSISHAVVTEDGGQKYDRCTLRMEGGKLTKENGKPAIFVYLACDGESSTSNVLIEEEAAIEDLKPDLFEAPGTPLTFFPEDGGLVHISDHEDSTFVLYQSNFENLIVGMAMAPLVVQNARVELNECRFNGNDMRKSGGVLLDTYMEDTWDWGGGNLALFEEYHNANVTPSEPQSGPMVRIKNSMFQNVGGGAINIDSFPYVHVKDSDFLGNYEAAVRYVRGGQLILDRSLFEQSEDPNNLGGMKVGGVDGMGPVLFWARNCTFRNNNMYSGGAVLWKGGEGLTKTVLHFSSCIMTANVGTRGGALSADGSFTLLIEDSLLDSNVASENGGGIYMQGHFQVNITDTSIKGGKAASGAALYGNYNKYFYRTKYLEDVQPNAVVIRDSIIDSNTGVQSGAVYLDGARVVGVGVFGTRFKGNTAKADGGAMHLRSVPFVDVADSTFVKNKLTSSRQSGGAIYAQSVVEMRLAESRFEKNNAMDPYCANKRYYTSRELSAEKRERNGFYGGGAVFVRNEYLGRRTATSVHIDECRFVSNTAQSSGGDLYFDTVQTVNITSSLFAHSLAMEAGSIGTWRVQTIGLDYVLMKDNRACGGHGGALFAYERSTISATNCVFEDNVAEGRWSDGGAIKATGGDDVKIAYSNFTGNSATDDSGAVHVSKANKAEFINNLFAKNKAGLGGAVTASKVKEMSINSTIFHNNSATEKHGGSVSAYNVKSLTVSNAAFDKSHAAESGGALRCMYITSFRMTDSLFGSNSAKNGGSVYMGNADQATMSTLLVKNSIAENNGGAMYLEDVTKLNMTNSEVVESKAGEDGGAFFVQSGESAVFNNLSIRANKAKNGSGGYVDGVKEVFVSAAYLYENSGDQAGGGMSVHNVDLLRVRDSTIANNSADEGGGFSIANVEKAEFHASKLAGNVAKDGGGGGILARDVTVLNGTDLTFALNEASVEGSVAALLTEGEGELSLSCISIEEGFGHFDAEVTNSHNGEPLVNKLQKLAEVVGDLTEVVDEL